MKLTAPAKPHVPPGLNSPTGELAMGLLLAIFAYLAETAAIFGGPLKPIGLVTFWANRLGAPYWPEIAALGVAASILLFGRLRNAVDVVFRLPVVVTLVMLLPTAFVGLYADFLRHRAVLALGADEVQEHSFFRSLGQAPQDFQIFLHTAALKNCTPYAWSYRMMAFYVLPPSVRANVLPGAWIKHCGWPDRG